MSRDRYVLIVRGEQASDEKTSAHFELIRKICERGSYSGAGHDAVVELANGGESALDAFLVAEPIPHHRTSTHPFIKPAPLGRCVMEIFSGRFGFTVPANGGKLQLEIVDRQLAQRAVPLTFEVDHDPRDLCDFDQPRFLDCRGSG